MKTTTMGLAMLAIMIMTALGAGAASAATVPQTAQWQIITMRGLNETTQFEAKDLLNITVYAPRTLATGSIRNLIIYSQEQKQELARYTLGFYSSGNQTNPARNVSVNLGAFPALIRGDTLLLQIQNSASGVEFTTAISIAVDINGLLDQQKQFFLGMIGAQKTDIDLLRWELGNAVDTQNRYIMMLAIVMGIVVAYVTRDQWLHKKRKTEEEKSTTEFEKFLEAYVADTYAAGDAK